MVAMVAMGEGRKGQLSQRCSLSHTGSPWLPGCTVMDPEAGTPISSQTYCYVPSLSSLKPPDGPGHQTG